MIHTAQHRAINYRSSRVIKPLRYKHWEMSLIASPITYESLSLQLINVIQKDSPSRRFLEIKNTRFPNDVSKLDVAVMRPPNMGNATQRRLFLEALSDLERTLCSVGRNTTDFWYFAYQRFVDRLGFGDSWAALNEDETVGLTKSYRNDEKVFLLSMFRSWKVLRECIVPLGRRILVNSWIKILEQEV